jgi:hypothetical protein
MKQLVMWVQGTNNGLVPFALALLATSLFIVWGVLIVIAALDQRVFLTLLLLFGLPLGLLYLAYWYDHTVKK